MSLLGDLHRAYDGPLPELARQAAGLGSADRWLVIAARRREQGFESMLRSVAALQPSLVSPLGNRAERLRWRAAALACRDASIARILSC